MGKSYTPKYRIEMKDHAGWNQSSWDVRSRANTVGMGKPTNENLKKKVYSYAKSLEIGGVNEGLSISTGFVPYPSEARIVNQFTGEIMAEWKADMFHCW